MKKGFLLTEESLIKLDDIIRKRLTSTPNFTGIQFKIFRADGMLVEFDNPTSVAAEENSSRNAIKRLEILSQGSNYKLSLKFDPKENTDLNIEAHDRDLAYLLASDIKDYMNSEILKFRSFSFDAALSSKNIFPLILLPMMFFSISSIKEPQKTEKIAAVLASSDIQAKLNFIIESQPHQDTSSFKWYLLAAMVGVFSLFFIGAGLDKAYPRNIFYWGKAAQSYDRLSSLREKIVWGIVIAFVIGIASTVAVDLFKASHSA